MNNSNHQIHQTEPHQTFAATPEKKKSNKTWIIILAVLALPVGIPLLLAFGGVLLGLVVAFASIVIAFFVSGLTFFVGGAVSLLATPLVIVHDLGFGLITGGMGLLLIGGSIIFIKLVFWAVSALCAFAGAVSRRVFRRA